jgi:hypothetical protein
MAGVPAGNESKSNSAQSTIHMGQMILPEPSIIIIWTYQHMTEWNG